MVKVLHHNIVLFILVFLTSCASNRMFDKNEGVRNIQELSNDTSFVNVILPDTKINLSVWGSDDYSVGSVFGIYSSSEAYGKWLMVDHNGLVQLPKVGEMKISGLTIYEAQKKIEQAYSKTILNPIVVIKILNNEVTILGEVRKPGNYLLEKEENSILQIIAKAEGLEPYAAPAEIKLIRNQVIYRLDLSGNNLKENNIIIKPGDTIYIPSQRSKMFEKKAPTLIPFASTLTALTILLTFLLK